MKRNPRPDGYAVTPELHAFVRRRDGECIAAKAVRSGVIESHICRDRWGISHSSQEPALMSVDHVHLDGSGIGKPRAVSDANHLTAMCYGMNVGGVPAAVRQYQRTYLRELATWDAEHQHVDPVYGCADCYPVPA